MYCLSQTISRLLFSILYLKSDQQGDMAVAHIMMPLCTLALLGNFLELPDILIELIS